MFFFRSRDPYYGDSPAAGCLGSLLATIIIAVILIVCAIYIGIYVLLGLLIIGAIIGAFAALFALFKALPQTIKDMKSQKYRGNKAVVVLKKIGYFFVCIAKYAFHNDLQYAKNAFQRFTSARVLSFSKWINLALAVTVLIFGLLMLAAIVLLAGLCVISLIMIIINIIILLIAVLIGIGILYNLFLIAREAIYSRKRYFCPSCFKFKGQCDFTDLLSIPKSFIKQIGAWIRAIWRNSMNLLKKYKFWLSTKRGVLFPLCVALIISCPVSAVIFIALASLIMFAVALLVYLVDSIWIIVKALFKV